MQSIDRAMNIIHILLSKSPENKLSISELANETDLPISTLHRILRAMMKHRLIEQDPRTKFYGIGSIWLEYGLLIYDTIDYVSQTRPELEKLMKTLDESVYLYKPMGNESLIIERIDSSSGAIRVYDKIGSRISMHIGASNHVMLAFMEQREMEKIVGSLIAPSEQEKFINYLNRIREKGYALSENELTEGTTSVAAPVTNHHGEVQGAVGIRFVNFNLTEDRTDFLIKNVCLAAKEISIKFGNQRLE
ncbi:IclR family transcriptional regulator [Virgibacillus sp. C22-A2]|uniref:IclR family transcriptional regulator n=1 Tax=Virgibacillus tibetensis TaxID=3042313 RepID=A0ABU6KDP6_9BACI|nr:IclR family transcriptional regulator [Virgibacillus sp. C22-A2]